MFMGTHFQGRLAAARQRLTEREDPTVMDSRVLHVQEALDAIEIELMSYLGGCSPFVGLAFANLIFDSLQRSNKALDLLLESVHIQEASYWKDWDALMCGERDDQIEFVSALLEDPIRLDGALGGEDELLALQMTLKHCFKQCAFDIVRQEEMELMVRLYDWVVLLSDTVVLSVPDRFAASLRAWQTLPNAFVALACCGNVCVSLEAKLEFIQASCMMKNSLIFENWRCNLLRERETQLETIRQILEDDNAMANEMSGERDVMQGMTLLQYAFGRFADRFIETEVEVGTRAFDLVAERSNTLVVGSPTWFNFPSPTYDVFRKSRGESKWSVSYYSKPAVIFRLPGNLAHSEEVCLRQANLWSSLSHPHVATLFGACHVGHPYFVYESGAPLHSYLLWPGRRRLLWSRMHEIALGLQFLHKRGVVYEGLSCRNVHVVEDELERVERVKLNGLNFVMAGARIKAGLSDEDSTIREDEWQWKAPECLVGEVTSRAANVYSLGMCIVEAVTGDFPWGRYIGESIGIELVRAGRLPPSIDDMPCGAWKLVKSMCKLDPEQRISISCALSKLKVFADDASRSHTTTHQHMSP
ncbi:hypothetical protein BBJ28_00005334 [Nothophytophthora sp. Chile5]|nr:hypothetical protein BBJ28_00005334 [Nothophytophthora sp. Chile5]